MPTMGIPTQVSSNSPFANIKMGQNEENSRRPGPRDEGKSASSAKAGEAPAPMMKGNPLQNQKALEGLSGISTDKSNLYGHERKDKMGKNEFMKLLTHQLQYQDPTKPADQSRMAADLAQFSQLEQLSNIQTLLEKQGSNAVTENKFYAASFLGKRVLTDGSQLDFKGVGTKSPVHFNLGADASKVHVRIFDKMTNMVAQIEKENLGRGAQTVEWDGSTFDGAGAGKGLYTVQVSSWDKDNNQIKAETKAAGIVTGVRFENGETTLIVDGKKVNLKDIESFELAENSPKPSPMLAPAMPNPATVPKVVPPKTED